MVFVLVKRTETRRSFAACLFCCICNWCGCHTEPKLMYHAVSSPKNCAESSSNCPVHNVWNWEIDRWENQLVDILTLRRLWASRRLGGNFPCATSNRHHLGPRCKTTQRSNCTCWLLLSFPFLAVLLLPFLAFAVFSASILALSFHIFWIPTFPISFHAQIQKTSTCACRQYFYAVSRSAVASQQHSLQSESE